MIDQQTILEIAKDAFDDLDESTHPLFCASLLEFSTLLQNKLEQDAEHRGFEMGIRAAAEAILPSQTLKVCKELRGLSDNVHAVAEAHTDIILALSYDTVKEKENG